MQFFDAVGMYFPCVAIRLTASQQLPVLIKRIPLLYVFRKIPQLITTGPPGWNCHFRLIRLNTVGDELNIYIMRLWMIGAEDVLHKISNIVNTSLKMSGKDTQLSIRSSSEISLFSSLCNEPHFLEF